MRPIPWLHLCPTQPLPIAQTRLGNLDFTNCLTHHQLLSVGSILRACQCATQVLGAAFEPHDSDTFALMKAAHHHSGVMW
jgi:hypothetical protein